MRLMKVNSLFMLLLLITPKICDLSSYLTEMPRMKERHLFNNKQSFDCEKRKFYIGVLFVFTEELAYSSE